MDMRESLSTTLRVPRRNLDQDIRQLAYAWDEALAAAEMPAVNQAFPCLCALVRMYLRGRGLRMGNYQGYKRHGLTSAMMATVVVMTVIEEGPIIFPLLHKLGFDSWDTARETLRGQVGGFDILSAAEDILNQKEGGK